MESPQPAAVEVHGLDATVSLLELRRVFSSVSPVLQTVAALDTDSSQGVALLIFSSEQAAAAAVELFDGRPLGNSFLHVKSAETLPNSLINLLYSLEQPSSAANSAAAARQQVAAASAYLEQQQQLLQHEQEKEQLRQEQAAWDHAVSQEQQRQQDEATAAVVAAGSWSAYAAVAAAQHQQQQQLSNGGGAAANGHSQQNGSAATTSALAAQQQQQQRQLEQLEADLRHLQMDRQQQQQQAAGATALPPTQEAQRQQHMSWASAAAAPPALAALAPRQPASATAAAALAASIPADEWQTAGGGRGRQGRRGTAPASSAGGGTASSGRAPSSVSSGSPRAHARSSGRRSDDKVARPGGQDGASAEPTTKLWMGGIDGTASAETVRTVFGRFGPIYDYELQPATHEKGRTDQWGFVNFKRLSDAMRAYEGLVGEVIPELTGTRKLKLQFRPVDSRRPGGSRR